MITVNLTILNPVGLHARPAAEFVKLAARFKSRITIQNVTAGSAKVDAKSILSVLTLGVEKNHVIEVCAEGADEAEAINALSDLVENQISG